MNRIDIFNEMVGLVFAQLYESFPVSKTIDPVAIAKVMQIEVGVDETLGPPYPSFARLQNGDQFEVILWSATSWLREEGFIRAESHQARKHAVLTAKALTILNATPANVGGPTLGKQLNGAVGRAGTETGRAVIGELVGQIIGGFTKSLG